MITTLVAFALVLGAVIVFHEFGHFVVAKLAGIYVKTFSIGFGPKLLKRRFGETQYAISALPLGGYVKMAGQGTEEEEPPPNIAAGQQAGSSDRVAADGPAPSVTNRVGEELLYSAHDEIPDSQIPTERWFRSKPLPARLAVIFAGPFANLVLAVLILAGVLYHEGLPVLPTTTIGDVDIASEEARAGLCSGDILLSIADQPVTNSLDVDRQLRAQKGGPFPVRLRRGATDTTLVLAGARRESGGIVFPKIRLRLDSRLGMVKKDGPAWKAGLRPGDRILSVDGHPIAYYDQLADLINPAIGKQLHIEWERAGEQHTASVVPEAQEVPVGGDLGKIQRIGRIQIEPYTVVVPVSLPSAVAQGLGGAWEIVRETGAFLWLAVRGHASRDALGGPIRIGQEAGSALRWGLASLLNFMAFLSVNLFMLNLLPIPVLDGGHVLFLVIEAVRGEALSQRVQERMLRIGVSALILLMGYVFFMDLVKVLAR